VTGAVSAGWSVVRFAALGLAALTAAVVSAGAQEMVNITVPSTVSFAVTDISRSTTGAPTPTTVRFSNAILIPALPPRVLRISVKADAATFTPPSGSSISSSKVSWAVFGANGGTGFSGVLSSSSYAIVFQSQPPSLSGQVNLGWTLAPPGSGIRSGNHQLTIRWKVESIAP